MYIDRTTKYRSHERKVQRNCSSTEIYRTQHVREPIGARICPRYPKKWIVIFGNAELFCSFCISNRYFSALFDTVGARNLLLINLLQNNANIRNQKSCNWRDLGIIIKINKVRWRKFHTHTFYKTAWNIMTFSERYIP